MIAAVIDDGDAVAQLLGLFEIVRGEQHRRARRVERAHMAPQLLAELDVDARGRLVEHQDRRVVHHRLGDHEPPAHAARERARIGVGLVGQADRLQQLHGAALGARHAIEPGLEGQHLARREEGVEIELLGHDADRGARLARIAVDVDVPDADRARGLVDQARHDVDQGRLASAVRAEQAEQRAARDVEIDPVERGLGRHAVAAAIGLGQAADRDGIDRLGDGDGGGQICFPGSGLGRGTATIGAPTGRAPDPWLLIVSPHWVSSAAPGGQRPWPLPCPIGITHARDRRTARNNRGHQHGRGLRRR